MIPGPNRILKTPLDGSLVKIRTLVSGNTFGARFWTDGKREAPMLPDQPWLRVIRDSGELFWADECEVVGEEKSWGDESEFADVPFGEEPTAEDYVRAIYESVAWPPEKEVYVRMRLWWAGNDPVRWGAAAEPAFSGHRENLVKLRELLSESDPNERLMAAEASRELGDFVRAAELLTFSFPEQYHQAVTRIKTLNEQKDTTVRDLG